MAAAITDKFKKVAPNTGWQLNASGIADAAVTSFTLVSATALPTDTAVILTVDRVDSSGTKTPSKMERIKGIVSGSNVISCVRGIGGTAQSHSGGAVVEIVIDAVLENEKVEGILVEHNQDGTHGAITTASAITQTQIATPSSPSAGDNKLYFKSDEKLYKLTSSGTESSVEFDSATFNAPRGFLLNGKFEVTDASGITVAIKTLAGTDPSSTNPVRIRIGDTVRSITSALSRVLADGTNWMNSGSAELATKEVDYFAYLVWDSNSSAVGLTFSRIPSANLISDFSATTTNEKYCAGQSDFTSTDEVEVIGRFAATLSAGAGYTWTVPTFTASNLIQRPIYETRWLDWTPVIAVSGGTAPTYTTNYVNKYRIRGSKLETDCLWINGSGGTAGAGVNPITITFPFTPNSSKQVVDWGFLGFGQSYESAGAIGGVYCAYLTSTTQQLRFSGSITNVVGNDQSSTGRGIIFKNDYEI